MDKEKINDLESALEFYNVMGNLVNTWTKTHDSNFSKGGAEIIQRGIKKKIIKISKNMKDVGNTEKKYFKNFAKNYFDIEISNFQMDNGKLPLDVLIGDFDFSNRVKNILSMCEIYKVGDLLNFSKNDILKFRNMGCGSVENIEKTLNERGYSIR